MRPHTAITLAWVVLLTVLLPGCGSANAGARGNEERARLEIKGSPGTEFIGSCTVGDGEASKIGGKVPENFTYDLKGRSLECEISSDDSLRVELAVGENTRSAQAISGGTLHLTYDNGSISTETSSSSGEKTASSARTNTRASGGGTSEPLTEESRDVSGFDGVELRDVGNLSIEQTGRESLTIQAEKDVLPGLESNVVNGRLILGPASDSSVQTTEPINYRLTVKDLRSLGVSGSANAKAKGIETDRLAITVSGTGSVSVRGEAGEQEVDVSGTGIYQAKNLESKEIEIRVAGAGSAIVNASERLDAEVGGVGSVEYAGNPTVQQNVSGVGRVTQH